MAERPEKRWCLFSRRHEIQDFLEPDKVYLTRWRIFRCPWFGIFLHAIHAPDSDRHLHSHPWGFRTLILNGGYWEAIPQDNANPSGPRMTRHWKCWSVHDLGLDDFHAISKVTRSPVWTLVLVGRRRKNWGFATKDGVIPWEEYVAWRENHKEEATYAQGGIVSSSIYLIGESGGCVIGAKK